MRLWLDDVREPWKYGFIASEWAKTADRAIEMLKTGEVTFASLDHDLAPEHYSHELEVGFYSSDAAIDPMNLVCLICGKVHAQNGEDVVKWMEANNVWPRDGVVVHSQNPVGRARMEQVLKQHYVWRYKAGVGSYQERINGHTD